MRRSYSMIRVSDLQITHETAVRVLKPLADSYRHGVLVLRSLWLTDCRGLSSQLGRHYGLKLEIATDLAIDILEFSKQLELEVLEDLLLSLVASQGWYLDENIFSRTKFWLSVQNSQD